MMDILVFKFLEHSIVWIESTAIQVHLIYVTLIANIVEQFTGVLIPWMDLLGKMEIIIAFIRTPVGTCMFITAVMVFKSSKCPTLVTTFN